MAAATQVFAVPELLELILLPLDFPTLYRLKRVNRTFLNTLAGSRLLRRKMFLEAADGGRDVQINPLLPSKGRLPHLPQQSLDWWSQKLRLVMPAVCLYYKPSGTSGDGAARRTEGFWVMYTYRALQRLMRLRGRSWRKMNVMDCAGTVAVWMGPDVKDCWNIEGGRQWKLGELMDHVWSIGESMLRRIEASVKALEAEEDRAAVRRNQIKHSDCVCM
ncbi:hypothetical protein B0A50_01270 [Salinomyces thailandicus]|uniref:F-box domain-containing protein n=1 Tax=Salinomyces thailandicus TaxID=706561 RepID=A0A4U0UA22_9PEZI|nr:hypothetical protein B0A50_01270 [Salinomyces thailandica]